jgi:hypothetical protein
MSYRLTSLRMKVQAEVEHEQLRHFEPRLSAGLHASHHSCLGLGELSPGQILGSDDLRKR